jgi:hypothetical protein
MKTLLNLVAIMSLFWCSFAIGADHLDPPERINDMNKSSDIADFYAWHQGEGADQKLVMVLNYGGPSLPGSTALYDADVLYTIHIDNTANNVPDQSIYVRFAQNLAGEWGVQVINLPGALGPIVGPANGTIELGEVKIYTGLRDDPFFFDLEGYQDTLATGTLSFDSTRDFFAGSNVSSIVLEVPIQSALGVGNSLSLWATTARVSN